MGFGVPLQRLFLFPSLLPLVVSLPPSLLSFSFLPFVPPMRFLCHAGDGGNGCRGEGGLSEGHRGFFRGLSPVAFATFPKNLSSTR